MLPETKSVSGAGQAMGKALEFHPRFVSGLLNPEVVTPSGVAGPEGKAGDKRYNVYRNNVTVSLVDALSDIFPACERLVGSDFFRAMAREYVRAYPPGSPLLFEYGAGFAAFIQQFEPAKPLKYLPDVARIERAWLDAYHSADAHPLDPVALASIPPEQLAGVRFVAHPACWLIQSQYAAISIFSANRQAGDVAGMDVNVAESGLIVRPELEVSIRKLPPGGFEFLQALLFGGSNLGEAAQAGASASNEFDLAANLSGMLDSGAVTEIRE